MSKLLAGVFYGIVFGSIAVATMVPLKMEHKRRAMLGAFTHRFAIGVVIATTSLPFAGWLNGLSLGLLLSIPDAIITKAWIPILALGAIGGLIIGYVAGS